MSTLYRELLIKIAGRENASPEAKKTCWTVVLTLLQVLFTELRKVRVTAEQACDDGDRTNGRYLWAILQAHRVQDEFVKYNFIGHGKFHPEMVKFLLHNMVPRSELERLNGTCQALTGLPNRLTAV